MDTDKINTIKNWLGTGSINIFGIQFSGKDSLAVPLAQQLGAIFVSSGDLVRAAAKHNDNADIERAAKASDNGDLTPTDEFRALIIPHLMDKDKVGKPLVLGSVGRWIGEEVPVMEALDRSNHPLKAVVVLNIPESIVWERWQKVKASRNGGREDDTTKEKIQHRIDEFHEKTVPVIEKYRRMNLVIDIDATKDITDVHQTVLDALYNLATHS